MREHFQTHTILFGQYPMLVDPNKQSNDGER
jgi:hypothetical protein